MRAGPFRVLTGWFVTAPTVSFTATDATSGVSSVAYQVNGGIRTSYTAPFSLPDGHYLISYRATDFAGNVEPSHQMLIEVDTTPPSVQIASPSPIVTHSDVTISWTGADATSGIDHYEVSLDGGGFLSTGTNTSVSFPLADGPHEIRVRAYDLAGNTAETEARFSVDTNIFSLSGPYSGAPTFVIIAGALAVAVFSVWRFRRKGTGRPPSLR